MKPHKRAVEGRLSKRDLYEEQNARPYPGGGGGGRGIGFCQSEVINRRKSKSVMGHTMGSRGLQGELTREERIHLFDPLNQPRVTIAPDQWECSRPVRMNNKDLLVRPEFKVGTLPPAPGRERLQEVRHQRAMEAQVIGAKARREALMASVVVKTPDDQRKVYDLLSDLKFLETNRTPRKVRDDTWIKYEQFKLDANGPNFYSWYDAEKLNKLKDKQPTQLFYDGSAKMAHVREETEKRKAFLYVIANMKNTRHEVS